MDNNLALGFLKAHHPDTFWVLTAIHPGRKSIKTKTFDGTIAKKEKAALSWLEKHNGTYNIYFNLNPVRSPVEKKASREDVYSFKGLHIDLDPRLREDLEEEQKRIKTLLTKKLPEGTPKPTWVIFSGGGYQAFWALEEPEVIDGDIDKAENLKLYNQQLEFTFGADACHNLDRIFRLPGTMNLPDSRKKEQGRKKVMADLVYHDTSIKYKRSVFPKANAVQMPVNPNEPGSYTVDLGDSGIEHFDDISRLEKWEVSDRVRVICVQGHHPDETKERDNSKSAWLFDAVCHMVRQSVPDQVIMSVITNPIFGISESVLKVGANALKYAARQVIRAKEEVDEPWLRKLNDQFSVIENMGGRCLIIEEIMDTTLNRKRIVTQSFEHFRNRFMNKKIQSGKDAKGNPTYETVAKYWLNNEKRRQFHTLVFSPEKEVPGSYNLWQGFAFPGKPGKCQLYLDHIKYNICNGNERYFEYLIKWMARCVQKPGRQGEVAIVLQGDIGTGKGFFARTFGRLFGRHYLQVSNSQHLVGNFNYHLRDLVVLFADEAFFARDKAHQSILKTLITEDILAIEAKGRDVEPVRNCVHLIMASNDKHVIPAGPMERRFFMLEVPNTVQQDTKYFDKLLHQLNNGGYEALLHFLLNLDLTGFNVRNVPRTDALIEQQLLTMSIEQEWWYRKLVDGIILDRVPTWETEVVKSELLDDFMRYTNRIRANHRGNETTLGKFLREVVPELDSKRKSMDIYEGEGPDRRQVKRRVPVYTLSTLQEARNRWDQLHGKRKWPTIIIDEPMNGKYTGEEF